MTDSEKIDAIHSHIMAEKSAFEELHEYIWEHENRNDCVYITPSEELMQAKKISDKDDTFFIYAILEDYFSDTKKKFIKRVK